MDYWYEGNLNESANRRDKAFERSMGTVWSGMVSRLILWKKGSPIYV